MLKKAQNNAFSYLLNRSHVGGKYLNLLNWIFDQKLGFNAPHKIKIKRLNQHSATVSLPMIKRNTNHIGTIHACAMATIGEFSSGVLLLKNFSPLKYRLILRDLKIEFEKQATSNLSAEVNLSNGEIESLLTKLRENDSAEVEMKTSLFDKEGTLVARTYTTWQLKDWTKTQFKFKK